MVLLWNESVKWVCRGFLPTRAQRHPVCQDSSWALPVVWPQASHDTRPHLISLLSEALALPSSWGCCGVLRRWQMEHCTSASGELPGAWGRQRQSILEPVSLGHSLEDGGRAVGGAVLGKHTAWAMARRQGSRGTCSPPIPVGKLARWGGGVSGRQEEEGRPG